MGNFITALLAGVVLFGGSWWLSWLGGQAFMNERFAYCSTEQTIETFTECFAKRRTCDFLKNNSLMDDVTCVVKGASEQAKMIDAWFKSRQAERH